MSEKTKVYPHVFPNMEDWPIYKLSEDRKAFVQEIIDFTQKKFMRKPEILSDTLARTIYLEKIRIKEEPWKVDPPNDRQFWNKIRKQLIKGSLDKEETESNAINEKILSKILKMYSEEIVGTFKIKTFLFARKFLLFFFNRLLNTAAGRNYHRLWGAKHRLVERFRIRGEIETIRSLMKKGTVVIVPTHFSNIDSVLIGYAMDSIVGLPHFSFGAGLNLYNSGYAAYYMNRVGAYRIDRRKKNPIYLETLKSMSNLSIQRGTNNLFFPGGTRSRSGALESKLKMGMLGTVIEAQRGICEKGKDNKVFVVPLVMSYHFVLEAKFMIEQYLRKTGEEQYIDTKDASANMRQTFKFVWKLFSESSDTTLSFGKPLDVLGNFVDKEGNSYDKHGNVINIKDYFISNGVIKPDDQREREYTKILADKIVDRYHKENIVLSSHLIAYTAFNLLRKQHSNLDLYGVLRLPTDDFIFPLESIKNAVKQIRERLFDMEKADEIKLSEEIHWDIDKLIQHGIKNMGNYHADKPLGFNKDKQIISEDFRVLYYYHNRLENYNLSRYVQWNTLKLAMAE